MVLKWEKLRDYDGSGTQGDDNAYETIINLNSVGSFSRMARPVCRVSSTCGLH
jgi:hypothetical protein